MLPLPPIALGGSLMWHHAHPSVSSHSPPPSLYAITLLDPTDFTLSPLRIQTPSSGIARRSAAPCLPEQPLNTAEFVNSVEADVDVDKIFPPLQRSRLRRRDSPRPLGQRRQGLGHGRGGRRGREDAFGDRP